MVATFCLVSCMFAPAQPAPLPDWLLTPQLKRGQEYVYRGTFSEESLGVGVRNEHQYRVESYVLVLDSTPQGAELAILTTLKLAVRQSEGSPPEPKYSSVRLELAKIDAQGRLITEKSGNLAIPLDGPPTLECGNFVEVPRTRVALGQSWAVGEDGRPVRNWKVSGTEAAMGLSCVKLVGTQQTDDWSKPRADHQAWRRQDKVWIAPSQGVVQKVERVLELREAGHQDPTQRSVLSYELVTTSRYSGDLFDDRRLDIAQAKEFWDTSLPWLVNPTRNASQLDALLARINNYLQKRSPTPYLEAVERVKRRVVAARRGEPVVPVEEAKSLVPIAAVGRAAPDFAAPDFLTRDSARLRRWLGKPIVLVFYNPASAKASELLRFAQGLASRYPQEVNVLGLAMSEDGEQVRKQHADLHLSFPILCGTGLRISYDLQTTPRLFVLDSEGVVRGSYLGWGLEIQESIREELTRWVSRR